MYLLAPLTGVHVTAAESAPAVTLTPVAEPVAVPADAAEHPLAA